MDERRDDPGETLMQRALRLKKARQAAGPKGEALKGPRASAAMPTGASKPWMKK